MLSFLRTKKGGHMLKALYVAMKEVGDSSSYQGYQYAIQDVLIVMLLGLFCRQETIEDIYEWSRARSTKEFLKREFNIDKTPRRSQFYKILTFVKHDIFVAVFEQWVKDFLYGNLEGKTVAIDGKSICSTAKLRQNNHALHIASALITNSGIIISSKECQHAKSSEIGAFRDILSTLDLKGAVVVADALHCKPKSATAVIESQADYLFMVKENNKNLRKSVELHSKNRSTDTFSTVEKNGGRIETRTSYVCEDIELLYNKEQWKNVSCVGALHREFEKNGITTNEWHYYISSKKLSAKELLHHARLEWRIESMHWLLDVHFSEDKTKVRDMEVQKNLNIMRKIIINFIKEYQASLPKHVPMSKILQRNSLDLDNLSLFLAYFKRFTNAD